MPCRAGRRGPRRLRAGLAARGSASGPVHALRAGERPAGRWRSRSGAGPGAVAPGGPVAGRLGTVPGPFGPVGPTSSEKRPIVSPLSPVYQSALSAVNVNSAGCCGSRGSAYSVPTALPEACRCGVRASGVPHAVARCASTCHGAADVDRRRPWQGSPRRGVLARRRPAALPVGAGVPAASSVGAGGGEDRDGRRPAVVGPLASRGELVVGGVGEPDRAVRAWRSRPGRRVRRARSSHGGAACRGVEALELALSALSITQMRLLCPTTRSDRVAADRCRLSVTGSVTGPVRPILPSVRRVGEPHVALSGPSVSACGARERGDGGQVRLRTPPDPMRPMAPVPVRREVERSSRWPRSRWAGRRGRNVPVIERVGVGGGGGRERDEAREQGEETAHCADATGARRVLASAVGQPGTRAPVRPGSPRQTPFSGV